MGCYGLGAIFYIFLTANIFNLKLLELSQCGNILLASQDGDHWQSFLISKKNELPICKTEKAEKAEKADSSEDIYKVK